jgi:hypothetical protein
MCLVFGEFKYLYVSNYCGIRRWNVEVDLEDVGEWVKGKGRERMADGGWHMVVS